MPALQQAGAAITGYQVVRIARQGHGQQKRVIRIIGFDLEVPLSDHMAVFTYPDRPGIIGQVGSILGETGINIGGMQVARSLSQGSQGAAGSALMILTVDSEITHEIVATIGTAIGATHTAVVNL